MGVHSWLHQEETGRYGDAKLNTLGKIIVVSVIVVLAGAIGIPLGLGLASTSGGPSAPRPTTSRALCESKWEENAHRFGESERDAYIATCMDTNSNIDALSGR